MNEPRPRRSRRFRLAALAAALVYAGGVYVAYHLVQSAWFDEGRVAGEVAEEGIAPGDGDVDAAPVLSYDRAAARATALRARESVYRLEAGGTTLGSAFVAWVRQGDSYLLTAHRTVAPLLAQQQTRVFVRRGSRLWTGEVLRDHRTNGLALVRVRGSHPHPLWQRRADAAQLAPGDPALIVPAGEATPIGETHAQAQERGRIRLEVEAHRLHVGAPVIAVDGSIAGVVTRNDGTGASLIVPIDAACEAQIRRCA